VRKRKGETEKRRTNVIFSPTYSYTISILILSSSFALPFAAADDVEAAAGAEEEVVEVEGVA
jgi:hypothetical protein